MASIYSGERNSLVLVFVLFLTNVINESSSAAAATVGGNVSGGRLTASSQSSSDTTPSSSVPGCHRSVLDNCLASIEPFLDSTSTAKGIPHTQEAVFAYCRAFKVGMSCIDDYKERCLNPRQQQVIERAVAGARHTFTFLCDDPDFQSEFLQHQSCFRGTALDWDHCANHFQNLVVEEMMANVSRADRNLGLCCAKHGFLRCVYYSAQFKCRKDGALFLMKVAQTLTDVQVHEDACRRIKFDEMCAANRSSSDRTGISRIAGLWLVITFLSYRLTQL